MIRLYSSNEDPLFAGPAHLRATAPSTSRAVQLDEISRNSAATHEPLDESVDAPASRLARFLRSPQRAWQFNDQLLGHCGYYASRALGKVRGSYAWQKAVTTYGRALGQTQANNFLILGASRSGTTALVDYLNCHPRIRCRGEILNSDYQCYGNVHRMSTARLKLHIESFFIKPRGRLAGAKILTYQLDDMRLPLIELIDTLRRPKIILLYREQTLEQYASLKLAEQSGVWHARKPADSPPIWLDPDDFVAFAERERRMWRENLAALDSSDVRLVTYEQLHRQPRIAMQSVFKFLDLKRCPVESFVAKLHDRPLAEKVANYRDFLQPGVAEHSVLRLSLPNSRDLRQHLCDVPERWDTPQRLRPPRRSVPR